MVSRYPLSRNNQKIAEAHPTNPLFHLVSAPGLEPGTL